MFVPAKRRGREVLDDPSVDPALALRSLRDVALANRLFGGRRAVLSALAAVRPAPGAGERTGRTSPRPACGWRLLDVGTGLGDLPAAVARAGRARGEAVETIGLELDPAIARAASRAVDHPVAGSALALPMADRSVDVVTCSLLLHHFEGDDAARLLRECTRVARVAVIVADLRRSWLAAAGLWLASWLLGFHPVSRADGILSIFRGYTADELAQLVRAATGAAPRVRRHLGWRLTATWAPPGAAPGR